MLEATSPNFRKFMIIAIIGAAAWRAAALLDYVRFHPGAATVQGDAGVYWDEGGRIASGHFVDDRPFFSIPLYVFFIAVIRFLGGGLISVYVVQTILHLATVWMIGWIAARKFNHAAGYVAIATLLLLEEPAFYTTRLLPATLQLFLVASILVVAQRISTRPDFRVAIALGLLTGLLALSFPPAILLVPLTPLWVLMQFRTSQRPNPQRFACYATVVAASAALLAIAPVTILNAMASRELIPITAHAGITFLQGNTEGADGVYTPVTGISARRSKMHEDAVRLYVREVGCAGSYGQIDRYFLRRGWEYLTSDPTRSARLVARKAYWFLTGRHYSDIYYHTLEQADGRLQLLRWAPIPTAWLMGPAFIGLCVLWHRRDWSWIELALLGLPLAVVVMFWYSPRYRLPAIPVLVLASAAAITEAARAVFPGVRQAGQEQRSQRPVAMATVLSILAVVGLQFVNSRSRFDHREEYRPQYEHNLGWLFFAQGDMESALTHFVRADNLDPGRPHVLTAIVTAQAQLGRKDDADRTAERLVNADPESAAIWITVGGLRLRFQQWAAAHAAFTRALALDAQSAEAHLGIWVALSAQGRPEQGVDHLILSVTLDVANPLAACEYGLWLAHSASPAEAQRQLSRCLELDPGSMERLDIRMAWESVTRRLKEPDR